MSEAAASEFAAWMAMDGFQGQWNVLNVSWQALGLAARAALFEIYIYVY